MTPIITCKSQFRATTTAIVTAALFAAVGCGSSDASVTKVTDPSLDGGNTPPGGNGTPSDGGQKSPPYAGAPSLCSRDGDDAIRDVFCGKEAPSIRGLSDLQHVLGGAPQPDNYGYNGGTSIGIFLGHSTSLSGHLVSPINPRVIIPGNDFVTLMAFQRGVQRAEIATPNRKGYDFNFYLLTFRQACNDASGGCTPGDLYTPSIESSWTKVDLQDAEELKNTPSDCRQCHQRGKESPELLMRELEAPWTHFFAPTDGVEDSTIYGGFNGSLITLKYQAAKGQEPYANLPPDAVQRTSGFILQNAVLQAQPLLFDAPKIGNERNTYSPDTHLPNPPQRSATWDREYAAFKRGEHLALPHFDQLVADEAKLDTLAAAYQSYLAGTMSAADLPDLANVFPDDRQTRAEIGLEVEPNATPAEALVQACGACHNDVLDQTISRARFNIGLTALDPAELNIALDRLSRASDEPGAMPPKEARELPADVRARLVEYLSAFQKNRTLSATDQELLSNAAMFGMAGNTQH